MPRQTWIKLLVDHKKAELWLPPGGHVDPGEDPQETFRREAMEELGIDAEFLFDKPILLTMTKTVGYVAKHTDVSLWYLKVIQVKCWITTRISSIKFVGLGW